MFVWGSVNPFFLLRVVSALGSRGCRKDIVGSLGFVQSYISYVNLYRGYIWGSLETI